MINTPVYSEEELEEAKKAWLAKHERDASRFTGTLPDTKRTLPPEDKERGSTETQGESFNMWELLKLLTPLAATSGAREDRPQLPPQRDEPVTRPTQDRIETNNFSFDDKNEDRQEKKSSEFIEKSRLEDKTILSAAHTLRNLSQAKKIRGDIKTVDNMLLNFINKDPTAQKTWDVYREANEIGEISPFEFKQSLKELDKQILSPKESFASARKFTVLKPVEKSRVFKETVAFEKKNESWMTTMMNKLYSLSESLYSWRPYQEKIEPLKVETSSGVVDLSEPINNQIMTNNVIIVGDQDKPAPPAQPQIQPPAPTTSTEIAPTTDVVSETGVEVWQPPKPTTDEAPGEKPVDQPTEAATTAIAPTNGAPAVFKNIYIKHPTEKALDDTYQQHLEVPTFKTSTKEFLEEQVPTSVAKSRVAQSSNPISLIPNANDYGPMDINIRQSLSNLEVLTTEKFIVARDVTSKFISHVGHRMYNNTLREIGRLDPVFSFLTKVYFPADIITNLIQNFQASPEVQSSNPDIQLLEASLRQPSLKQKFDNTLITLPFILGRSLANRSIRRAVWKYMLNKFGFDTRSLDERITYERAELTSLEMERQELGTSIRGLWTEPIDIESAESSIRAFDSHPFNNPERFRTREIQENLKTLAENVNLDTDFEAMFKLKNLKEGKHKTIEGFLQTNFPGVEKSAVMKYQKKNSLAPVGMNQLYDKASQAKISLNEYARRATDLESKTSAFETTLGKIKGVESNLAKLQAPPSRMDKFLHLADRGIFYYEMLNIGYEALREIAPILSYDRTKDISEAVRNLVDKNIEKDKRTRAEIDTFMKENLSPLGFVKYQQYAKELRDKFERQVAEMQDNKASASVELAALNKVLTPEQIMGGKEFTEEDLERGIVEYSKIYLEMIKSKRPNYSNQHYDNLIDMARDKDEEYSPNETGLENISEKSIENLAKSDPQVQEILGNFNFEVASKLSDDEFKAKVMNLVTLNGKLSEDQVKTLASAVAMATDLPSFIGQIIDMGSKNDWFSTPMYLALSMIMFMANRLSTARRVFKGSGMVKGCKICGGSEGVLVHDKDPSDLTCTTCFNSRNATSKNYNKRTTKLKPIEESTNPEHKKYLEDLKKEKMEQRLKNIKIPTRHEEFFEGAGIDEKFKYRAMRGHLGGRKFSPKTDYKNLAMLMGENDHGSLNDIGRMNLSALITKCLSHNKDKIKGPIRMSRLNHFNSLSSELEQNPKLLEHYTV